MNDDHAVYLILGVMLGIAGCYLLFNFGIFEAHADTGSITLKVKDTIASKFNSTKIKETIKSSPTVSSIKNNLNNADIKYKLEVNKKIKEMKNKADKLMDDKLKEQRDLTKKYVNPLTIKEQYDHTASYYDKAIKKNELEKKTWNKVREMKDKASDKITKEYEKFLKTNPLGKKIIELNIKNKK